MEQSRRQRTPVPCGSGLKIQKLHGNSLKLKFKKEKHDFD